MIREDEVVMEERLRSTYGAVTSRTNYSPPPSMLQGVALPLTTSTSRRLRRVRRDRPRRLVAQVPAFSVGTVDEAERRRVTRRAPVVIAIAACLTVAFVVSGWLLFSGSSDSPSVQTPAGVPAAAAAGGCPGKVYVTNGNGTVSVITTATGAVSARITVPFALSGVAITPDGKHAYVTNVDDPTVVITTATGAVSSPHPLMGGKASQAVAITPDGKHAYVTSLTDTVSVITTATGAVSAPITVGNYPTAVAITPDGKRAYVTNGDDGTVSVIDTATGAVSAPITVGRGPNAVAITPDGKRAYVTNGDVGTVSVITTATGAVSAPITVGMGPTAVAICPARGAHRR